MDIRPVKMSPNLRSLVPTAVFVRRREGERMESTCLLPTVKYGGDGVFTSIYPLTFSALHKDMVVGTKDLKSGLIFTGLMSIHCVSCFLLSLSP